MAFGKESTTNPPDEADNLRRRIEQRAKAGFRGYPVGTVAYYGLDDQVASKVVASIVKNERAEADPLAKWVSAEIDARQNVQVLRQVLDFLDRHHARSVVVTPGIYGCPHEEGLDYPEGQACPLCPFWAGRDRDDIFRGK